MKLFAIADLHLDGGAGKPMDVFGPQWAGHCDRIFGLWRETVGEGDVVLIPGDISWAMRFGDALPDLNAISELPGKKVLLRGNHDYWWSSLTRMRAALPEGMALIQNDAVDIGPAVIAGSRGWSLPASADFTAEDRKIYEREAIRLNLSLAAAKRLSGGVKPIIAMMHFPPMLRDGNPTAFTEALEKYGVSRCLYGHLHGSLAWEAGCRGEINGVFYELCSADSLGFKPKLICEFGDGTPRVEDLLKNPDFPYLQPYFYNNALSLRCELSTGTKRSAIRRAREIMDLLMGKTPEAVVFNYHLTDFSDSGPAAKNAFDRPGEAEGVHAGYVKETTRMTRFLLDMQAEYRHAAVKDVPSEISREEGLVLNNRIICYSDGKGFDTDKLIKRCIDDRANPNVGLVSFENDCILSIYDDRGCDVIFANEEKFLEFYPLLEPYFLEYDRERMEERQKAAKEKTE